MTQFHFKGVFGQTLITEKRNNINLIGTYGRGHKK